MNKINYYKARRDTDINNGKINQKIQNTFLCTSKTIGLSTFILHNKKLKNNLLKEEEKNNFLNLTNIINKTKNKLFCIKEKNNNKLKYIRDKNISLFKNSKNLFGKDISHKKKNYNNSKSILRMKNNNKNIRNIYISKKNIILNNFQKSKINNSNNKYNANFSEKKKINIYNNKFQILNKGFSFNYIHHQKKTDLEKFYKKYNNKKNNNNSYHIKIKNDLRKKIIIKKLEKKERSRNYNLKKDLFNIRSFIAAKKGKRDPKKIHNQNNDINAIKKNILLKYQTISKANEFKENESKFLNYELANSDSLSTLTNFLNNNNINFNNQEIIENESPIEEIERKANEIYNSGFKKKNISYIRFLSKDLDLNNEIEELKDGEEIQNILTLSIKLL